jgi:hypothetical protein
LACAAGAKLNIDQKLLYYPNAGKGKGKGKEKRT